MKKSFPKFIQKSKNAFKIFSKVPLRQWGLASRLEHRRIKGNQKKKQKKG